jgi:hypothetical protein
MLATALAACGGSSSDSSEKPESGAGSTGVPQALQGIEASAEDIVDLVPHARWDRVRADVAKVSRDWQTYRGRAAADGATPAQLAGLDGALARLGTAAGAQRTAEVMQASNDASGVVVELYALYHSRTPVGIGRLDVIGRQIGLDVDRGDLTAVAADVAEARAAWDGQRADVVRHGGKQVAARTDATITDLERATRTADIPTLRTRVDALLERVDDMERLYVGG